jgi:hypothetical protein
MKIKVLNKTKVVLFASLLLATCLFAGTVNAQSFQGKFTLHHTARWGQAVIPAGEYRFTMDPGAEPALVVIYDANNGRRVAFVTSGITEGNAKGNSALLIGRRGNQREIYSFRLAELGETFVYDPALAHHRGVEEANGTETVPVMNAKK